MNKKFPRMLHNYLEKKLEKVDKNRKERFLNIKNKKEMLSFVKKCRSDIKKIYNLPKEKCPLNTKVTGVLKCKQYRIEKLIFESRPGFFVTANLYIPNGKGPFPGVVGVCGHSLNGKSYDAYQSFSARLARENIATLTYDPIGQGERFQYPDKKEVVPGTVCEHILLENHLSLLGEYFGTWRAFDGIRALDCLLERAEVDSTHLGITGCSGGGTMTTVLSALEDRFTMSAPSCFITTYLHNFQNELPADTEQVPPEIISKGYEMYDHLASFAPRPVLICTAEDDFFDLRGAKEAFEYLKKVYSTLGYGENIKIVTEKGGHGYGEDTQKAMVTFFCKHSNLEKPKHLNEKIELKTDKDLQVTKNGQVLKEGSKSIFYFTREKLEEIKKTRREFSPNKLKQLLSIPEHIGSIPEYRILRPTNGFSRFAVETENGIFTMLKHKSLPDETFHLVSPENPIVYIPHIDSKEDYANDDLVKNLIKSEKKLFFVEPRGIGESMPGTCGDKEFFSLYDSDFMYSSYCSMLGFSLCGKRVFDILKVLQLLRKHGAKSFTLTGRGLGAISVLYASVFDKTVKKVIIKNCLKSFDEIINTDAHKWPCSILTKDILLSFDLPDIVNYLKKEKQIKIIEPWDINFEVYE